MLLRQCHLTDGPTQLTAWLDAHRLRPGLIVTLKSQPGRRWTITAVHDPAIQAADIPHAWHVGGL